MTAINFLKKCNKSPEEAINIISGEMKCKYIPHLKKCEICGNIISSIMRIENGVMNHMEQLRDPFYFTSLLLLYWGLEFDPSEVYDLYDYACENNIYDLFILAIPEEEVDRFDRVYDLVFEDYTKKYSDIRVMLIELSDYLIENFGNRINGMLPLLDKFNK